MLVALIGSWTLFGRTGCHFEVYQSPDSGLLLPTLGFLTYCRQYLLFYLGYSAVVLIAYHQRSTSRLCGAASGTCCLVSFSCSSVLWPILAQLCNLTPLTW